MRTAAERSDAARAGGLAVFQVYGSAHMRRIGAMARRGRLPLPRITDAARRHPSTGQNKARAASTGPGRQNARGG